MHMNNVLPLVNFPAFEALSMAPCPKPKFHFAVRTDSPFATQNCVYVLMGASASTDIGVVVLAFVFQVLVVCVCLHVWRWGFLVSPFSCPSLAILAHPLSTHLTCSCVSLCWLSALFASSVLSESRHVESNHLQQMNDFARTGKSRREEKTCMSLAAQLFPRTSLAT